jgi:hypothetical protein
MVIPLKARTHGTGENQQNERSSSRKKESPGPGSNRRPQDTRLPLQSYALPTELPGDLVLDAFAPNLPRPGAKDRLGQQNKCVAKIAKLRSGDEGVKYKTLDAGRSLGHNASRTKSRHIIHSGRGGRVSLKHDYV